MNFYKFCNELYIWRNSFLVCILHVIDLSSKYNFGHIIEIILCYLTESYQSYFCFENDKINILSKYIFPFDKIWYMTPVTLPYLLW